VAQGKRRRAESTILESASLIKALTQQTSVDEKALQDITQVRVARECLVWCAVCGVVRIGGQVRRCVLPLTTECKPQARLPSSHIPGGSRRRGSP
jgi:hypothetical protein